MTHSQDDNTPSRRAALWRWPLFIAALLLSIAALLTLPRHVSQTLLLALMVAGLVALVAGPLRVAWRDGHLTPNAIRRRLEAAWQPVALIWHDPRLMPVGLLLMLAAALVWWPRGTATPPSAGMIGLLLFIAGTLALIPALARLTPADSGTPARPTYARLRVPALLFGIGLLAYVTQVNLLAENRTAAMSQHLQVIAFVAGVVLIGRGLAGETTAAKIRPRWRTIAPLLAIMALGLAARLLWLETGIHRIIDEGHFMQAVADLSARDRLPVLMPHGGVTQFTWLFPYGQWLLTAPFPPTLGGLRLLSVIFGTLQIAGVYFLARELFDRRTALIAALLLATFPPHLQFSRLGLNNIAEPTFALFALTFLVRGLRHRQQRDFAWAGVLLGMTHYFYEGGRLFYTPFVVLWLGWLFLFLRRKRDPLRLPSPRHALIFAAGIVLVALPVYMVWLMNNVSLIPRLEAAGVSARNLHLLTPAGSLSFPRNVLMTIDRASQPFLTYTHHPEVSLFYGANTPFVLPPLVPVLLVGWAACAARLRQAGGSLLFWWIIGTAAAMLTVHVRAASPRFVLAFPALALMLAVGFVALWDLLPAAWRVRGRVQRLAGGLIAAAVIVQGVYYFGLHLPYFYERTVQDTIDRNNNRRAPDLDDAMFRAVNLPPYTDVHFMVDAFTNLNIYTTMLQYYRRAEDITFDMVYADTLDDGYFWLLPRTTHHAFFIARDDAQTLAQIQRFFPDVQGPFTSPWRVPPEYELLLYFWESDDVSPDGTIPARQLRPADIPDDVQADVFRALGAPDTTPYAPLNRPPADEVAE